MATKVFGVSMPADFFVPASSEQDKAGPADNGDDKMLGFIDAKATQKLVKQLSDSFGEQVAKLSPKKTVEEQTEQSLAQADTVMDATVQDLKEEKVLGFIEPKLVKAATGFTYYLFSTGAEEVKLASAQAAEEDKLASAPAKGVLTRKTMAAAVLVLIVAIAICMALAMTEEAEVVDVSVKRKLCLGKLCLS